MEARPIIFPALAFSQAEVLGELKTMRELDQDGYFLYSGLAWVASEKGDFAEAVASEEKAVKRRPATGTLSTSQLGVYYARLGDRGKAMEVLESIKKLPDGAFGKSFHMALVFAGLGERDEMFECLDEAFEERSLNFRYLRYLNLDPDIRKDQRYGALFQRAGLVP